MPYIGNPPAERFTSFAYQDLTGGSGTSFTLDNAVGNPQEIEVFVNNVRQEPGVAYTVSGTGLTMTGSIASTDDFYVVFQGKAIQTATHPSDRALTATDGTFTSSFTSPGIDDNADATAITIDSSENVMIGTTDSTPVGSGGISLRNEGRIDVSRDGGIAANFERRTSDGSVVQFYKDGTTVGSIGVTSTKLAVGGSVANDPQLRFGQTSSIPTIQPADHTGTLSDNSVNIGNSSYRFKDLYLSGGAYIGGTGAANYLDDYEEGTWTPAVNTGSGVIDSSAGYYTKVGNQVTVYGQFRVTTNFTSPTIAGLPFTVRNVFSLSIFSAAGAVLAAGLSNGHFISCASAEGGTVINLRDGSDVNDNHLPNTTQSVYRLSLTYQTS